MNILITGASGFIGSHLCRGLVKEHDIFALCHSQRPTKWIEEALADCFILYGDVTTIDWALIFARHNIERVIHLAAISTIKLADVAPVSTFNVNVMGTLQLMDVASKSGIPVLFQSTDKVYGNRLKATITDVLSPTDVYGTSKACADLVVQSYLWKYSIAHKIIRPCNVYGYDWNSRIIPNEIRRAISGEQPIIYKDNKDRRQYMYIGDLVSTYKNYILRHKTPSIINMCPLETITHTQEEVVREICKQTKTTPKYIEGKSPLKQINEQSLVSTIPLGYIKNDFTSGIRKTIKSIKKYG